MSRTVPALVSLFGCAVLATMVADKSAVAATGIASAGLLLAVVLLLLPAIEVALRKASKAKVTPTSIEWEIRREPVRVVVPTTPTNTTSHEEAVRRCDEGRSILASKQRGEEVDLDQAIASFETAVRLSPDYWEALFNLAAALLFKGQAALARSVAEKVLHRFGSVEPLAHSKAALLIAKVDELRIAEDDAEREQESRYSAIASDLEKSLRQNPSHITTRLSLGRVYLYARTEEEKIHSFIDESLQFPDFRRSFSDALDKEGLVEEFVDRYPVLARHLREGAPNREDDGGCKNG